MPKDLSDAERNPFALEMIAQRAKHSLTQEQLAAQMIVSPSTVANIESCYRAPTPDQAMAADRVFDTPGTFTRHEKQLRGVPFSAGFRPFYPHETQARLIRTFEHSLVPGLFQLEEYALVLMETYPEATEQMVRERLAARLQRQQILYRQDPPPPRIHAILDEHVLHRGLTGPAAMAKQMEHLAELARQPRISIQVIPEDRAHTGLLGAFVIAETSQSPAMVYTENVLDGQVIESAHSAERIDVVFRALQMEALTGRASLAKIEESAQRWNERVTP